MYTSASNYLHGQGRVPITKVHFLSLFFLVIQLQSTFSNHVHFRFWSMKAAQGFQNVRDIFQACERTHWQWEVPRGITTQRF